MIEIIRQKDDLNREVWQFWANSSFHRVDLVLDEYSVQTRETKRHKWKTVVKYGRQARREFVRSYRQIELDDVPVFSSDVVDEVMAKFMATVTVKRER